MTFVYNIMQKLTRTVCLTMVDVPGWDGVADEPGEEMMGEPDENGVGEVIGVSVGMVSNNHLV